MISDEIQKLLSNITKSLTKVDVKDLDAFISGEFTHVTNIDFHRYEISHKEVINVKFSLSSFRGAFIMYSSFTNCSFLIVLLSQQCLAIQDLPIVPLLIVYLGRYI